MSDLNTQNSAESHSNEETANGLSPLEAKVQELEAQLKEKEQKFVYLYADFENYKKRVVKERSDLLKYGWEASARQLLEVIDNLERALAHMPKPTGSPTASNDDKAHKTLEDGLKMVLNQFKAVLEKQGVQHISAESKPFDPNFHEAIGQEKSEQPEGHVVREEMKGYTIHGRLLRPSRVIVSGGAAGH